LKYVKNEEKNLVLKGVYKAIWHKWLKSRLPAWSSLLNTLLMFLDLKSQMNIEMFWNPLSFNYNLFVIVTFYPLLGARN